MANNKRKKDKSPNNSSGSESKEDKRTKIDSTPLTKSPGSSDGVFASPQILNASLNEILEGQKMEFIVKKIVEAAIVLLRDEAVLKESYFPFTKRTTLYEPNLGRFVQR